MPSTTLEQLFALQASQQKLWYSKDKLDDDERLRALDELIQGLYEETAELARVTRTKPHIVRPERDDSGNQVEEAVDVAKYLFAICDLLGISATEFGDRFEAKTNAVRQKVKQYRIELAGKRVFVTDLDECLADLTPFFEATGGQYGTPTAGLLATERLKDTWYNGGGFTTLPLIDGAKEALAEAQAEGCLIAILTARPVWEHYRVRTDTVAWLEANGVPCDILCFGKDKWDLVYQHVMPATVVGFVEDRDKHIIELGKHHVPNIMMPDRPWNADFNPALYGANRVADWGEITQRMRDINWGKPQGAHDEPES